MPFGGYIACNYFILVCAYLFVFVAMYFEAQKF